MSTFFIDLIGTMFVPSLTLRRVARRRSLLESVAALLLVSVLLVALRINDLDIEPSEEGLQQRLFQHWLRVTVVGLAVWLFFGHLLWRVGWLLGGRTALRPTAATTAMALAAGGAVAALAAGPLPWWVRLPLLVWAWWILVTAVRRGQRIGHARAAAATLVASVVAWACYAAALPWRFERVGVGLLLAMWGVETPGQHLLLPNLVIVAALVVLTVGVILAAAARARWVTCGGLGLGTAAAAALAFTAWFVGYLNRFLRSPLDQPHAIAVAEDGSLLVKGVGGGVRLDTRGAVVWRRRDVGDGMVPGPGGSTFLLHGAEGEAEMVTPDGRVARTLALPPDLPLGLALRLGATTYDRGGRVYLLMGQPARIHRISLADGEPRDDVVAETDLAVAGGLGTPLSMAVDGEGRLYLAERRTDGRCRVLRLAEAGLASRVLLEEPADGSENPKGLVPPKAEANWRLVAGLDGAIYLSTTHLMNGRVARWVVRTLSPEGTFVPGFAKTADQPDCVAAANAALAVDAEGRLYAADPAKFRVAVFDPQGRLIRVLPRDPWYRRLAVWLIQRTRTRASRNPSQAGFSS